MKTSKIEKPAAIARAIYTVECLSTKEVLSSHRDKEENQQVGDALATFDTTQPYVWNQYTLH